VIKNILIFGASGHAKVIIDIVEKQHVFHIVGLIDTYKKIGTKLDDYEILGTEEDLPKIVSTYKIFGGIIAIGDNFSRMKISERISEIIPDFQFVTAIHPKAIISKKVMIGDGSVIMAGAIVNSNSAIGTHAILNTKCAVDHDCKIGDFASIAPGVTLGGGVEINIGSAISLGANVIENISIGKHTVVGAGALVLKSIGAHEIAYGVPAKTIRQRKPSDKYLGIIDGTLISDNGYTLKCIAIRTDDDVKNYHTVLGKFKAFNTFYSLEYCNHGVFKKLHYFLFSKNSEPCVLMPIFLNKIDELKENTTTTFYAATSPYGFSGPLINEKIVFRELQLFWREVDHWYQSNHVITEFVRFNLNNNQIGYSGYLLSTLNNVKGKLTTFNEIWDNFKPKVRNNYRKAEKNNLRADIVSEAISQETISSFYDIYIKTMVRNNATQNYFYSGSYFENLIHNEQNKIVIALIYFEDHPISTELLIINEDVMYSYLGGTMSDYFNLRPNDFLKIEMIKWGLQNNIKYYALGGGRKDGDSLYQYKKSLFPKDDDVMFYTGRKVIHKGQYKNLMQKLTDDEVLIENHFKDISVCFPLYINHEGQSNI
jgi:sugar O-acyltransferase (sialic acid O-acetyltransferase NeuD family)